MIRRLTFTDSPAHKTYLRLIWIAFSSRGSASSDARVTKDDRRSDSRILRALKSIAEPVGDPPKDGELDGRPLQLRDGGGSIELEQPEFKRLQKYVEETQWAAAVTDVVADLEDWFEADAEKVGRA